MKMDNTLFTIHISIAMLPHFSISVTINRNISIFLLFSYLLAYLLFSRYLYFDKYTQKNAIPRDNRVSNNKTISLFIIIHPFVMYSLYIINDYALSNYLHNPFIS